MPDNLLKRFHLINYLLGALLLVAILLLSRNIISFSFSKKGPLFGVPEYRQSGSIKKKEIMEYKVVLEKNPFGRPMKLRPLAVERKVEGGKIALADIVLVGTAVGPESLSYAIFENKSLPPPARQEVVAYGESVFNYGKLTKIKRSSVEIQKDGRVYKLDIPLKKTTIEPVQSGLKKKSNKKGSFARKVGERQYILDSRRVQQSLKNPEQILTDARLLPNIIDGRQEGFKISEVVRGGIYDSLGLKNRDILLRINGLEISNPEVAMQAMTALKGMNKVDLDIIRSGKNMSMSYQVR